jgi:hypothetical protein
LGAKRRAAAVVSQTGSFRALIGAAAALLLLIATADVAIGQSQPSASDPLVVVESFLAARNARNSWEATTFCADLVTVHSGDTLVTVDDGALRAWLSRLTDEYAFDTLVRPQVDGETVAWTERLVARRLPFKDALAASIEVRVQAVVHDSRIISLAADYPGGASNPATGLPAVAQSSAPPAAGLLFIAAALGVTAVLILAGVIRSLARGSGPLGGAPPILPKA